MTLYSALSKEAADDEASHRWRLEPNVHLFQEVAEFQGPAHGNPRNFWTQADEDFVGWIVKIARSRGGQSGWRCSSKGDAKVQSTGRVGLGLNVAQQVGLLNSANWSCQLWRPAFATDRGAF